MPTQVESIIQASNLSAPLSPAPTFAQAFVKLQAVIRPAIKDATNPAFRSKYADLGAVWEAVRQPLADHGFGIIQSPQFEGETMWLETTLLHVSGEKMVSRYPLRPVKQDPQGFGSAITYAKRYAISAMLGVVADIDDDGNAASAGDKPTQRDAIHGASTLKTPEAVVPLPYAPSGAMQGVVTMTSGKQETEAREWGEWALPRVKTMDKDRLDKFQNVNKVNLATLKALDPKTSIELEKALAARLEELFA